MAEETTPETQTETENEMEATSESDIPKDTMDATEDDVDKIMEHVEEHPPDKLEDWPGGKAKYRTIGGTGDANEDWEDGPTAKLGPADLRHHADGSVSIAGDTVDNPEDYKGEPIPGGPTDPDAPEDPAGLADEAPEEKSSSDEA